MKFEIMLLFNARIYKLNRMAILLRNFEACRMKKLLLVIFSHQFLTSCSFPSKIPIVKMLAITQLPILLEQRPIGSQSSQNQLYTIDRKSRREINALLLNLKKFNSWVQNVMPQCDAMRMIKFLFNITNKEKWSELVKCIDSNENLFITLNMCM